MCEGVDEIFLYKTWGLPGPTPENPTPFLTYFETMLLQGANLRILKLADSNHDFQTLALILALDRFNQWWTGPQGLKFLLLSQAPGLIAVGCWLERTLEKVRSAKEALRGVTQVSLSAEMKALRPKRKADAPPAQNGTTY